MSLPPSDLDAGSAALPAGVPMPTPATLGPRPTPPGSTTEQAAHLMARVDAVDAAVRAVPGVVDLHTGAFGEVATYLPGRRVAGIRLLPHVCEVHVVLAWGVPIREAAAAIRLAVAAAGVPTRTDITIEDVVDLAAAASARSTPIAVAPPAAIEAPPDSPTASKETL